MLPTDYTSATGYAASGKRHHLWKPGGYATTAASTDSLVAQRGCDSCRTVQNRCVGRDIWYAASCSPLVCGLSLHKVSCIKARRLPLHRDVNVRSLRAVSSARNCQSPPNYLSAVDPGSRNRYRPRAAENPRKLLCNASLVLSTVQRDVPWPLALLRTIVPDWPS